MKPFSVQRIPHSVFFLAMTEELDDLSSQSSFSSLSALDGEENHSVHMEDGQSFTPFNMKTELQTGRIDRHGHYVEHRQWQDQWWEQVNGQVQEGQDSGNKRVKGMKEEEENSDEEEKSEDDAGAKNRKLKKYAGGDTDDDEEILKDELGNKEELQALKLGKRKTTVSNTMTALDLVEKKDELKRLELNKGKLLKDILTLMQAGETVSQAVRRLGKKPESKTKQSSYRGAEVCFFIIFF